MNANELRIGHLVYLKSKDKIYEISSGHDIEEIDDATENFDAKPIPLTEEWHNKFEVFKSGFESFAYVLPRKNNISLKVIFTGDYVMLRQGQGTQEDDVVSIWNKDLTKRDMYVHEWQNLYFSLTGKELIIQKNNDKSNS